MIFSATQLFKKFLEVFSGPLFDGGEVKSTLAVTQTNSKFARSKGHKPAFTSPPCGPRKKYRKKKESWVNDEKNKHNLLLSHFLDPLWAVKR